MPNAPRTLPADPAALAAIVAAFPGRRVLLGICGKPGAGKSTLARALVAELGEQAVQVPMDGFHLADAQLRRMGLRESKGAPETFDAAGYARLLEAIRSEPDQVVYAPAFERDLEQPLAGAIAVLPEHRVIVSEGNYLLMDGDWARARAQFDAIWVASIDESERTRRLIARHQRYGKSPDAAETWVQDVDEVNAAAVHATFDRADGIIAVT